MTIQLSLVSMMVFLLLVGFRQGQAAPASNPSADEALLGIYVLAFDNNPDEPMSLSAYYTPTIQGILAATALSPTKSAVILADMDGGLDTHILIAQGGLMTSVVGLPVQNSDGLLVLDETQQEWDMANGDTLGTFLRWATEQYPHRPVLFSFLGHGAPVVPKVNFYDLALAEATPAPGSEAPGDNLGDSEPIPPLPAKWGAHQGFTDFHSASLLSISDLGNALAMATNNGANPFMTIDLVQCFSSSIEELYELHNYAETIIASPNYTYSKPEMVGAAFAALSSTMSATEMTETILATYDEELPVEGHPRLLVGVESNKIPAVKRAWDATSHHLVNAIRADEADAKARIKEAYDSSAKYDTTLCKGVDYALAPPDALSDMGDFATQLSSAFGQTSLVGSWAITTTQRINDAIIVRYAHNGSPWFAEVTPAPVWTFDGPGISLFTDFSADSATGLSWQAYWYSDTVSARVPQPLNFLQDTTDGVSWADLFTLYWGYDAIDETSPDFNSSREQSQSACEPAFLSGRGYGELTATNLTVTTSGGDVMAASQLWWTPGLTFTLSVDVESQAKATNPQVRFNIYRNDRLIMAQVETPGYMAEGSVRQVTLSRNWEAKYAGLYTFEVMVDADERFIETNETDNIIRSMLNVISPTIHLPFIVR